MQSIRTIMIAAVLWTGLCATTAQPAEVLVGPIEARVLRVIDGDTIEVRARIWLGQHLDIAVRLADIDAPELNSRCPASQTLALFARSRLHQLVAGTAVTLYDIQRGKYAGRVVADVVHHDGRSLNAILVSEGLAYPTRRSGADEGCRR